MTAGQKHGIEDPAEMARLPDAVPIEQVARRWIAATTPGEVVEAFKPDDDLGSDHLVFSRPAMTG